MERMAKSKDISSRKKHKKSYSPKSRKDSDSSSTSNSQDDPANVVSPVSKNIHKKQKELARVINLKNALLLREDLSYLEYQELREEICRLNVFKELLNCQEAAFKG